jgi:RNA-directed DNA polymerase
VIGSFSAHSYSTEAAAIGRSTDQIHRALKEQRDLSTRRLPIVWSLGHLAWLAEAPYSDLRSIVSRNADPYTDSWVTRPFRRTRRHISAPASYLQRTQKWILRNILVRTSVHSASAAFEPGDSTLACAQRHVGCRWLIKLDLADFFDSINELQVHRYFVSIGYPALVAFEMARICTRVMGNSTGATSSNTFYSIDAYQPGELGVLPQGAPTSGAIANRVVIDLDKDVEDIATHLNLTYTRYADDIVLSAGTGFNRPDVAPLIKVIRQAVHRRGFQLNDSKIKISPPGAANYLLGLLVLDNRVVLPQPFKRELERAIRGVDLHGVPNYARRRGFVSMFGFVNHVSGKLAYAMSIEPAWAKERRQEWMAVLSARGVVD